MKAELDREAKAIVKLLDNFGDFNEKVVDDIASALASDGPSGILTSRFKRKMTGNNTYRDLADKTKKQKKKKSQKYTMNATGDTLKDIKRTTKGKVKGNKILLTAKVPDYAEMHQKGKTKNGKKLEFFSFNDNDEDGKPMQTEVRTFNKVAETQFNKNLAEMGIRSQ